MHSQVASEKSSEMETYQIFLFHLAIFVSTGVAVLLVHLAAAYGREMSLLFELRKMKKPPQKNPVFVDVQSAPFRMGQVAVGFFNREKSASSVGRNI
tara:strand:+ start:195329 stop:195619 length:291 start_codon:yes stop_codon:yes gene_type:complete